MNRLLLLLATSLCATTLWAQDVTTAAEAPDIGPACAAPEHRQFDFWLGRWSVVDSTGNPLGTSLITRVANGCGLREEWSGAQGTTGTSLNYYDRQEGVWRQDWVGGGGTILHLRGGFDGETMRLSGERESPQGRIRDQLRWRKLADGRVRQEWLISTDEGKSWTRAFLGFYEEE